MIVSEITPKRERWFRFENVTEAEVRALHALLKDTPHGDALQNFYNALSLTIRAQL